MLSHVPCHEGIHCLIKHHAMKTYGVVTVNFDAFLTSALGGGEWLVLLPGKKPPLPMR